VSNATRFTEKGGVALSIARQDHQVLVTVTDTGPGIALEDAEKVFEPFVQATGSLWQGKGGSGLGLSISRQFVKLHGGQMWLESELGVGTSFHFTLPISSPVEPVAGPAHQIREDWFWRGWAFGAAQGGPTDQLLRPRVIVCDETRTLCPEFARYAEQVEFVDAPGLTQAIQELRRCPAHAVVVNTTHSDDIWPLIEAIRREATGTPIIGCSVPRLAQRAIDAGAQGYLIKPVTRADFQKVLRAVDGPVRRVLVVDDDLSVLELFRRMLWVCDSGLEVTTVSSGEQALDELRRAPPDLMLLDVMMPDMDGWQVLEAMVRDEAIREVPTFFVSAQDPADQPPVSRFLVATMGDGLSLSRLLRCSLEMSALLLRPEAELDLAPG